MTVTETAAPTTRRLSTAKALSEGIALELERDASVFVMGEDVGAYGGIFGSTGGLLERFGAERIIDTPISETGFIGAGIGAATEGLRPVVELMFVDFFGVCFDQIYNHMAKIHFESGGNVKVPMVLMMAVGGGYNDAAQHSQCLWASFAHMPGMKVVVPSNPYDAKGLMISAIRDDGPVIYMFHKGVMGLPWMAKNPRSIGEVPEEAYTVPLGEAAIVHPGEGISAEVIDLRSLVPLDREAVLGSVAKTGRLLVVDEDYKSFGLSGELAATVVETDPALLKAPFARVTYPDVPVPYARALEQAALPSRERIEAAIRGLVRA